MAENHCESYFDYVSIYRAFKKKEDKSEYTCNPKNLPIGSVIYFADMKRGKPIVNYGTVIEHYAAEIAIQLYDFADNRLVDGIPYKDFPECTEWRKLPKGWSYDTALHTITAVPTEERFKNLKINNPKDIEYAINEGHLVKVQDKDYSHIAEDIDRLNGYRLRKTWQNSEYHPDWVHVPWDRVFSTYEEAYEVYKAYESELIDLSKMSDRDWAIREMNRVVRMSKGLCQITDEDALKCIEYMLDREDLEDLEFRLYLGRPQYKKFKNKKWADFPCLPTS